MDTKWIRNFIQPEPGHALLYFDYSAEEVGIAAALSGGKYLNGDITNRGADHDRGGTRFLRRGPRTPAATGT
jgi:hypothetical protein